MRYGLKLLHVSPAPEPLLTLVEAKLHSRIYHDMDDAMIPALVEAATQQCEEYAGRAFVDRTFLMALEAFPSNRQAWAYPMQDGEVYPSRFGNSGTPTTDPRAVYLPRAPLETVERIEYLDRVDDTQSPPVLVWRVLSPTKYYVASTREPALIVPAAGCAWPCTAAHPEAVRITYRAGYGSPDAVPAALVSAVKLAFGHLYEHREDVTPGVNGPAPAELPYGSRMLLDLSRVDMP